MNSKTLLVVIGALCLVVVVLGGALIFNWGRQSAEKTDAATMAATPQVASLPEPLSSSDENAPTGTPFDGKFAEFPATIYRGSTVAPDFNGSEREYAEYRTLLTDSYKSGVNFAGHYHLTFMRVGTGGFLGWIINLKNGAISPLPFGESFAQMKFYQDSRLAVLVWEDFSAEQCHFEGFEWTQREFRSVGRLTQAGHCPTTTFGNRLSDGN